MNDRIATIHASCVALDDRGILLLGPSGSGKSDLALRLVDGGASLVADDRVVLSESGGTLLAGPPPALAGRLEVRGLGIVDLPWRDGVHVTLAVTLVHEEPPRLPASAVWTHEGAAVRQIALQAFVSSAAAKVRLAAGIARTDDARDGAGREQRR